MPIPDNNAPNLVLVGFMATGKSTIGRACARALEFRFHDSDRLIERRAGASIPDVFREQGEPAFREMEARAIRDLAGRHRAVISTGGGVVLNSANVAYLRRTGVVLLLTAPPDVIVERTCRRATRPLLADAPDPCARVEQLLREREPYYRAAAHAVVATHGLSATETAAEVLRVYHSLAPSIRRPADRHRGYRIPPASPAGHDTPDTAAP